MRQKNKQIYLVQMISPIYTNNTQFLHQIDFDIPMKIVNSGQKQPSNGLAQIFYESYPNSALRMKSNRNVDNMSRQIDFSQGSDRKELKVSDLNHCQRENRFKKDLGSDRKSSGEKKGLLSERSYKSQMISESCTTRQSSFDSLKSRHSSLKVTSRKISNKENGKIAQQSKIKLKYTVKYMKQ